MPGEVLDSCDMVSLLAWVVLGALALDPIALTNPCHDSILKMSLSK